MHAVPGAGVGVSAHPARGRRGLGKEVGSCDVLPASSLRRRMRSACSWKSDLCDGMPMSYMPFGSFDPRRVPYRRRRRPTLRTLLVLVEAWALPPLPLNRGGRPVPLPRT